MRGDHLPSGVLDPGRVDQLTLHAVQVEVRREIIASCAGPVRHNRRASPLRIAPGQGVEEAALAGVRPPAERHADPRDRLAAEGKLPGQSIDLGGGLVQLLQKLLGLDERQVFIGKVQPGLHVGQQFQEIVAEQPQGAGQPSGELFQGGIEFRVSGGVDHTQHGLGLGQVDASGEERAERELARLGGPRAPRQTALTTASKSGGEPSVWTSATGWPV